jgi:hypothetical protein
MSHAFVEHQVTVAESGDHLVRDGAAWFLLADTIWSAFTHVPMAEWHTYLERRRRQGFNALLVSVLPVLHDMTEAVDLPEPFDGFWSGRPRFGVLRADYLEQAVAKIALAFDHGFTPILADLWCNYAPRTWASNDRPEYVLPAEALDDYLGCITDAFRSCSPIHMVSGDTDFYEPESISYYKHALSLVKEFAPESLTTMHLQPEADLPSAIVDSDDLDVYMFQSGHHLEHQHLPYALAARYRALPAQRPIVNIEPAYDGAGHGFLYGRFDGRDVRRASWQSVLTGASAGLGYGAHGVWQWHRRGAYFNHAEFSGTPFDRSVALEFSGANDVAFLKHLVDTYRLFTLQPAQELLVNVPEQVRAATVGQLAIVYAPYAIDLTLRLDNAVRVERWNLEKRELETLEPSGAPLVVPMPDYPGDSLLVVHREVGR